MHFGDTDILTYLAPTALALALGALWTFGRDRRDLCELGHRNLVLSPALAILRRGIKGGLVLVALVSCALGAARWQGKTVPEETGQYGMDVVVVLDVSKSMLTRDVAPDRLTAAKKSILDALEGMDGDRVALVVFAGDSLLQVPLTLDRDALATVLEGDDVDAVDKGGTNFTGALGAALKAFPEAEDGKKHRGRAILLYTDGEPTAGEEGLPMALQVARRRGVAVACVGVGSRKGQPIPDGQSFWGQPIYKRDAFGRVVVSRLDEETLRNMADATGGLYVAGDSPGALSHVENLLSGLDKTFLKGKGSVKREELSPKAGLASAAFLLLAAVI